jgi:hypothetical protein
MPFSILLLDARKAPPDAGYGSVTTPTANLFKVTDTGAAADAGGPPAVS